MIYHVIPVWITAFVPIIFDLPTSFPSWSLNVIPSFISFDHIIKQFAKLAVPTAANEIKKLKNSCFGPVKCEANGFKTFLIPSPTPTDVVTAAR